MKSSEYWQKRFLLLEEERNKENQNVIAELTAQYKLAQRNIVREIESWYQRFANNNEISLVEARKKLNKRELAELKWDVNEYIKRGKEYGINGRWAKELKNASARVHISRLEALKLQIRQQLEVVKDKQLNSVRGLLERTYETTYYKTAFEIQRGFNIGVNFARLDEKTIKTVLEKPWTTDGRTFSKRIWANQEALVNRLNTHLTQAIIKGDHPSTVVDKIKDLVGASTNKGAVHAAKRLLQTESAYFASKAQLDSYKELGVKVYKYLATLDKKTSAGCRDLDGEVFSLAEYEIGVTAPPLHPNCRSTTVPYFEDMEGIGKRSARGEAGKTYYVRNDIKYEEWLKTLEKKSA